MVIIIIEGMTLYLSIGLQSWQKSIRESKDKTSINNCKKKKIIIKPFWKYKIYGM